MTFKIIKRAARIAAACFGMSLIASAACTLSALAEDAHGPLILDAEGSFFVGGTDTFSDALIRPDSPVTSLFAASGTYTVNQMYVQYKIPQGAKRVPVILIHGCCLTGKTWETTPDGRQGWEEFFVRQGHPVYVVEQVGRGRSGFDLTKINEVALGTAPPAVLPPIRSGGHEGAWEVFRFGAKYPEPYPGLQFPVEAVDQFWRQIVPDFNDSLSEPNPTLADLSILAKQLGRAVLISHSQSGPFPQQTALIDASGIAGIIEVEGFCPGGLNKGVDKLAKVPTMLLFGDYTEKSSYWAGAVRECQPLVSQIAAAGGDIKLVKLPDIGIFGNSHMLMQDRNNLVVADFLDRWIAENVETEGKADPSRH
jgi:hypothetical protein